MQLFLLLIHHQVTHSTASLRVTLCATWYRNSDLYFPSSHFCFPYFSIPNSSLNPLICLWNSLCLTLTILPVSYQFPIYPDQRFCNPISDLLITPCCACIPALFPVVIKASHQCIVESVQISTKYNLLLTKSLWLPLVWNTLDLCSPCCSFDCAILKYRTWQFQVAKHISWSQVHPCHLWNSESTCPGVGTPLYNVEGTPQK